MLSGLAPYACLWCLVGFDGLVGFELLAEAAAAALEAGAAAGELVTEALSTFVFFPMVNVVELPPEMVPLVATPPYVFTLVL